MFHATSILFSPACCFLIPSLSITTSSAHEEYDCATRTILLRVHEDARLVMLWRALFARTFAPRDPHCFRVKALIGRFVIPVRRLIHYQRPWTEEDDKLILERRAQGVKHKDIAAELGIESTSAVASRFHKVSDSPYYRGIPAKRPFTEAEDNIIVERTNAGGTIVAIAIELERPKTSISHRRAFLSTRRPDFLAKLPKFGAPFTPDDDQLILSMKAEGYSAPSISRATGRHPRLINSRYCDLKFSRIANDLPSSRRKKWLTQDTQQLVKLRASGYSYEDIAAKLHRTVGSCQVKLRHIGPKVVSRTSWTQEEDQKVLHLRDTMKLRWIDIASQMPNRTLPALQYRYHRIQKSRHIDNPHPTPMESNS